MRFWSLLKKADRSLFSIEEATFGRLIRWLRITKGEIRSILRLLSAIGLALEALEMSDSELVMDSLKKAEDKISSSE